MQNEQNDKRTKAGRTQIGDNFGKERRENSFSYRCSQGKLDIIKQRCTYCNHHKAFATEHGQIKCTRCKRIEE